VLNKISHRSIAAEAVTFEAPKVTQSAYQPNAPFAAQAFARQIRQNWGRMILPRYSHPPPMLQQNPNARPRTGRRPMADKGSFSNATTIK
jgi:hypothetical protein